MFTIDLEKQIRLVYSFHNDFLRLQINDLTAYYQTQILLFLTISINVLIHTIFYLSHLLTIVILCACVVNIIIV